MEQIASRVVVLSHGRVVADSGAGGAQADRARVIDLYREANR
jgi:ABC-type branched-subunit amino acid transport system ATPase component